MCKREATRLEVLLAIAMSGYYQTTHVKYLPVGTTYRNTLRVLQSQKYILSIGKNFFKLSSKGKNYILSKDIAGVSEADTVVDAFIDRL